MSDEEWVEYVDAVRRKVKIATHHSGQLEVLINQGVPSEEAKVIAMQAAFEGVLYALIAAADQTAEALNLAYQLELEKPTLQQVLEHPDAPRHVKRTLGNWQQAPIAADVRDIRRLATHHHYEKTPAGTRITVQQPRSARPYGGPRDLVTYSRAAAEHAERLESLLPRLFAPSD